MLEIEGFILNYLIGKTEQFLEWEAYCAPFHKKYFTTDQLIRHRQSIDHERLRKNLIRYQQAKNMSGLAAIVKFQPVVVSIDIHGKSAVVVTSEQGVWESEFKCHRYHLLSTEAGWRIDRKGVECPICNGSGKDQIGKHRCSYCKGIGWKYYGASRKEQLRVV